MSVEEMYVVYHTLRDTIVSVHPTLERAELELEKRRQNEIAASFTVTTLDKAISWEIQAALLYERENNYRLAD